MIAFLDGRLAHKEPTFVILDVGGVGYHVNISLTTFAQIKNEEKCRLITHLHVKEDSHTLYGFSKSSEKSTFQNLISISGIGPSTALMMLSSLSPSELKNAIIQEDVKLIQSVKGIGGKTAQRVILELKDKMLKDGTIETGEIKASGSPSNTVRDEALQALTTLGIPRATAEKSINKAIKLIGADVSVEVLIKEALKTS